MPQYNNNHLIPFEDYANKLFPSNDVNDPGFKEVINSPEKETLMQTSIYRKKNTDSLKKKRDNPLRAKYQAFWHVKPASKIGKDIDHYSTLCEAISGKIYQQILSGKSVPKTRLWLMPDRSCIASKHINGFIPWINAYDEQEHTLLGNKIVDNVVFYPDGVKKEIKGYTALLMTAIFLGETDLHSQNFGVLEDENTIYVIKIDHSYTLYKGSLETPITQEVIKTLYPNYKRMDYDFINWPQVNYLLIQNASAQKELHETIYHLLHLDFQNIESIIEESCQYLKNETRQDLSASYFVSPIKHLNQFKDYFIMHLRARFDLLRSAANELPDYIEFEKNTDAPKAPTEKIPIQNEVYKQGLTLFREKQNQSKVLLDEKNPLSQSSINTSLYKK